MKEFWKSFGNFWMCVWVLFLSIALQLVGGLATGFVISFKVGMDAAAQGITDTNVITQRAVEASTSATSIAILVVHLMILLVFGLWYGLNCRKKLERASVKEVLKPKNIGKVAFLAVGLCFFVNFALDVVLLVIPDSIVEQYTAMMESAAIGQSLFTTIAAVCIAPIGEELVFRGTALYYSEKMITSMTNRKAAFWLANTVQALGFGIFHLNFVQGLYAFVIGLVLGYLARKYKSVIPCIIAHMVINATSTFIVTPLSTLVPINTIMCGILAIIFAVVVAWGVKVNGKVELDETA